MLKSKTLSISIGCSVQKVYAFVSHPANLPKWAKTFCRSARSADGRWIIETPEGEMNVRFAPPNDFGVLDHYLNPGANMEVFVPMRVVANGTGSEMIFTLFQQPGMSDGNFTKDMEMVKQDLQTLKAVLEQ